MSNRFAWLLGAAVLVAAGLLVACGSTFNSSTNGLVVTGSQGSALLESFGFDLASGHVSGISNPPSSTSGSTCVLPGIPSSIVLDPAGTYAYAILTSNSACKNSQTGIVAFKVNSNGTLSSAGSVTADPSPVALAMDAKGKFLFVAEGTNSLASVMGSLPCPGTNQTQYGVCVYAIGSGGSLTPVQGTFTLALQQGFQAPNFVALAATPTVFPGIGINGTQSGVCTQPGIVPPTIEFLYAADELNNVVWEFQVDPSSGALGNPTNTSQVQVFAAHAIPSGVAVDPCDRFVYVTNMQSNQIDGYTICNGSDTSSPNLCNVGQGGVTIPDGKLVPISGSPFSLAGGANGPGPLVVDPFGNFVYVLDTLSNQVSGFRISPVSGSIAAISSGAVATGSQPKSIAIRGDDNWMFVSNYQAGTLSQYSITPSTGALAGQPEITTDNYPWGVAVK